MRSESTSRSRLLRSHRSLCRLAAAITVACLSSLTAASADDAGYALQFDGTQQVDGTNTALPQGNAARTMEAWINPSVAHNGTIFNYGTFASNKRSGILLIRGSLYFVGENNDVEGYIDLPIGEWTHVAASYDGTYMTLYVNGVVDRTTAINAHNATGYNWRIGNGSDISYFREPFKGTIDEVRVWDYARSKAQIRATMLRGPTGDEDGLVGYYKLDDGPESTTTEDSSDSESDGELDGVYDLPDWVDGFDPDGGYGPNNRPVYLILSLDEEFDTSGCTCECEVCECGSDTVIINIGTFLAGNEIPDTRFELRALAGDILEELDLELPISTDTRSRSSAPSTRSARTRSTSRRRTRGMCR